MALIDKCKMAMRITTSSYDSEIQAYIEAAMLDLGIAGVETPAMLDLGIAGVETPLDDALINKAVMTYVRMSFGAPANYDKLKESYDEQKAQLMNATGYTDWGV